MNEHIWRNKMSKNDYPNRDALRKANDIYLSVMRSFIKHNLRQVRGERIEDLIRESLHENQLDKFDEMLEEHNDVEFAIDFNFIPQIIYRKWEYVKQEFKNDLVNQSRLWLIRHGRNRCEHIGPDLDAEFTRTHLYTIAELLGQIGRTDKQKEIEEIRDKFLTDSADDKISEISEKLYAEEKDNSKLKKDLADANIQIEKLEKQQSEKQEKIDALQDVKDAKEEIENNLIVLKADFKKLSKDFKDTEDMWKDSETSLTTTKNLLEKVENERDSFKERVSELEQQQNETKKQKQDFEEQLQTLGNELDIIKSVKATAEDNLVSTHNLLTVAFDKQIFPPLSTDSTVRILDRKGADKKNYLLKLLEQEQPSIIYVQDEDKINEFYERVAPEKSEVIGRHNDSTTKTEEKELLEKLEKGELIAIVSNDVFSTLTKSQCIQNFVFCHLVHGLDVFYKRCTPAFTSSKSAFLHLIYENYDEEQYLDWLTQKYPIHKYPTSEELRELYMGLKDLDGIKYNYVDTKNVYEDFDMLELKFETCCTILEELGLLRKSEKGIKLLPPEKRNLEDSDTFSEGENIKHLERGLLEFYYFQYNQTVEQIWEKIVEKRDSDSDGNTTSENEKTTKKTETSSRSKVTEEQVKEIRQRSAAGETYAELSEEFGVSSTAIWNIVKRNTWKHVE